MKTRQNPDAELTIRQRALIEAIDRGHTSLRDLMNICDYSSISVVKYNLELLQELGHVALAFDQRGVEAWDGTSFCQAWDAACRLAGNPDA